LILFVDDEPLVVNVVRNVLGRAGYDFRTASGADEAEALFREHADEIELLVTDVMMPGRNGRELYEDLRRLAPDLPVVFVSGYVNDPKLAETLGDADRQRLLEKPFRPAQLLETIESVLEANRAQRGR
jgi:CheY-like chemotaxis protein